jgi:hypothetical protein
MGARKLDADDTVFAIMAHDSAQPTVDQYEPRWKTLGVETRIYIPEGDKMAGGIPAGKSAHSGIVVYDRFLATLENLLATSDKNTFIVAEYDTVNLTSDLPKYTPGTVTAFLVMSCPHNQAEGEQQLCALSPWVMDRKTAQAFIAAGRKHIQESGECEHLSGLLDRWIGEVMLQHDIQFESGNDMLGYPWKDGIEGQIASGRTWVHGFKSKEDFIDIWNQYPI